MLLFWKRQAIFYDWICQGRLIASDVMSKQQVRVFLWAVPRSISTAFFRAMMNKTNCKVGLSTRILDTTQVCLLNISVL